MQRLLLLLSLTGWHVLQAAAQHAPVCDKIVLGKNTLLESAHQHKTKTLKVIDAKRPDAPRLLTFNSDAGLLYAHPLAWQVVDDSLLFLIRTYSDHLGMTYTDLLRYHIDSLKHLEKTAYERYLSDNKNMIVKNIAPLFFYALRIAYRADTLKGPVYYDLSADSHRLSVYIYIDDHATLEKWLFNWYPAISQDLSKQAKKALFQQDPWKKTAEYAISLNAPFKVFGKADNHYLMTQPGDLYYLDDRGQTAKGIAKGRDHQGVIPVFHSSKNQMRFMTQNAYLALPEPRTQKSMKKASKQFRT